MTINTAGKALWACPTEHQEKKNAAVDLSTERKPDLRRLIFQVQERAGHGRNRQATFNSDSRVKEQVNDERTWGRSMSIIPQSLPAAQITEELELSFLYRWPRKPELQNGLNSYVP